MTPTEAWARHVLVAACNETQLARVVRVLQDTLGDLPDMLVATRRPGQSDRDLYWGMWRALVINNRPVDLAVKRAIGYRDSWAPADEPEMARYHGR